MRTPKTSVSFALDTRRPKANGAFPVKLRVIHNRQNRLYGTIFSLTQDDFEKVWSPKPRNEFKEIRRKLDEVEHLAERIISDLPEFSFDAFAEKWHDRSSAQGNPNNVFHAFAQTIKDMERENRIGNAVAYGCALRSLQQFHNKPILTFPEVTIRFLKEYEVWMKELGNSQTTTGIYLRSLRAIFNSAIAAGIVRPELYPFGAKSKNKYRIPASQNIKKALSMVDIAKIFNHQPSNQAEALSRDLWVFSYLCNGANMKDICLLRYSDIEGDRIEFRRAKTANTIQNTKPIVADYSDTLKEIVSRWGNPDTQPESHVFPFIQPGDGEKSIKVIVANIVKQTNKYIKRIAQVNGITAHVTTYTARHSFATTLKNAGVSVAFISESMGHKDIKTTQSYLASIEDTQRKEISQHLTNF